MKNLYRLFLIIVIVCLASQCLAQEKASLHFTKGCLFSSVYTSNKEVYTFPPSKEAIGIITKIQATLGLKINFTILAATIDNAFACIDSGKGYIYYSEYFMQQLNLQANTPWPSVFILAHEIGHHLNWHTWDSTGTPAQNKRDELAADEFAGFMVSRLGASLTESQSAIQSDQLSEFPTDEYPAKKDRLEAVTVGWKRAKEAIGTENEKQAKDCVTGKTGDFCFTNAGRKTVNVFLYLAYPAVAGFTSGSPHLKKSAGSLTIEPGQTSCLHNIDAITWEYEIKQAPIGLSLNSSELIKKGVIIVESCKSKTLVIK